MRPRKRDGRRYTSKVNGRRGGRRSGQPPTMLGRYLRALRVKKRRTVTDLARRLGVHRRTVYRWEMGIRLPTVNRVLRYREALKLSDRAYMTLVSAYQFERLAVRGVPLM